MPAKNAARAAKSAKTTKQSVKFESDSETGEEETISESGKQDPIEEALNATEELTDSKPAVKRSEKKKLTERQEELTSRQNINEFMKLITNKYGKVKHVNVFAHTPKNTKVYKGSGQYGEYAFCNVNVVRALVFTDAGKHELLAKELWELFEFTPKLVLRNNHTKNIDGECYMQIIINGNSFTSKSGKTVFGHDVIVYISNQEIELIKQRVDQFNAETTTNGYKLRYPWFDDSDLIGNAKSVGIEDF